MNADLADNLEPVRLALIGIGQELRGDDGAGVQVIRRLRDLVPESLNRLLILDAGNAPENILGIIIRHRPDIILFIDAALMDCDAGEIVWLEGEEADGYGGSTHTLPLGTLARYITSEIPAAVFVLAIQPEHLNFSETLSPKVEQAVDATVEFLADYCRSILLASSASTSGGISVVNA